MGIVLQDNRSIEMPVSSRQKTSRSPVKYRTSHHGRKKGRGSHVKGTAMSDEDARRSKQRRRNNGRGRGKGQGKHRHNKSRQNRGDASPQHSHIRRNLEKQLLVGNRTLELLGGGGARILWTGNSTTTLTNGTSNPPAVFGDSASAQRVSPRLAIKNDNNTSSDIIQLDDSITQSQMSLPQATAASGTKTGQNISNSRGNTAFKFSERSQSAITPVDNSRARNIPVPIRSGADEAIMTDYQYDYDGIQAPGVVESSVWFNPTELRKEDENTDVSTKGESSEPGPMQAAVGTTLETVLGVLTDHSGSGDSGETSKEHDDPCEKWMRCKDKLRRAFLGPLGTLPSCPCNYPSAIFYDDKIWDQAQGKYYR